MKKILLSAVALMGLTAATAQVYTANSQADFASWTSVDVDGDGHGWTSVDSTGATTSTMMDQQGGFAVSYSYDNPTLTALTPDNIYSSTPIDMSGYTGGNLSWKAGSPMSTASNWYAEKYAVYIINNTTDLAGLALGNFPLPVYTGTIAAGQAMEAQSFDVSSDVSGQSSIYIVVRHYDCTDMFMLMFDDVELTGTTGGGSGVGVEESSLEVLSAYPNPTTDILNISLNENVETASILSLDGKLISTENVNSTNVSLNVEDLSAGIYFYEVVTSEGDKVRNKFIKK